MNKFFLLFILFFYSLGIFSQKSNVSEITYLDKNSRATTKEHAVYLVSNKKLSDDTFLYKKYSQLQTGKPVLIKKYFYNAKGQKKGKYILNFTDGYMLERGFYIDDLKHGTWKEYNKIPQKNDETLNTDVYLKNEISYNYGKKEGVYKEYYADGNLRGDCKNVDNFFIGDCTWYFKNGQISSIETYAKKGQITNVKQFNKDGSVYKGKNKLISGPISNKKMFSRKLQRNFRRSFNYNKIKKYGSLRGKIILGFRINKQGKIDKVKIQTHLPSSVSKEAKRVLLNIKNIKPSFYHNQRVSVWFRIPITITVESHR